MLLDQRTSTGSSQSSNPVGIAPLARGPETQITKVGECMVERSVCLCQDVPHVDMLMHHESVKASVPYLHDGMQQSMDHGEASKQEYRARHRGGKV